MSQGENAVPKHAAFGILMIGVAALACAHDLSTLPDLDTGRLRMENALWCENPIGKRFDSSTCVVIADIEGPARIEMIHFAMPEVLKMTRDAILRIYWDGEPTPSVDCPLVDFFCDPAGQFDTVETALVNKRRGYNAYFPMPFRKSARVEVIYDGDLPPGPELVRIMPCYSYVMYRELGSVPKREGYFHACWRQEAVPMGKTPYVALEAQGRGKFVGWHVTLRRPGSTGYLVDMNEKFFIDGEKDASVEFQGIEDSFGFSYGFPDSDNVFPLTGYRKYFTGAACYRFFVSDAIPFMKSLTVLIDLGVNEHPLIRTMCGPDGLFHEFSSVAYWYQTEPHAPLPSLPPAAKRAPAPDDNPMWPGREELPGTEDLRRRGVHFYMLCGRETGEVIFAEEGFSVAHIGGYTWMGWRPPVYHCRADDQQLDIVLAAPIGAAGTLRLYMIDPDGFGGGRRQQMFVEDRDLGVFEQFTEGRWVEAAITPADTADGQVHVCARNLRKGSNAVLSIIEWVSTP